MYKATILENTPEIIDAATPNREEGDKRPFISRPIVELKGIDLNGEYPRLQLNKSIQVATNNPNVVVTDDITVEEFILALGRRLNLDIEFI